MIVPFDRSILVETSPYRVSIYQVMFALHVSSALHALSMDGSAVVSINVPPFCASVDSSTSVVLDNIFFGLQLLSLASRRSFLRITYYLVSSLRCGRLDLIL